jgi:hypothetical protein
VRLGKNARGCLQLKLGTREIRAQEAREAIFAMISTIPCWNWVTCWSKELTALKIAAMADERPIAVIVRRVMRAWPTKEGFLHPNRINARPSIARRCRSHRLFVPARIRVLRGPNCSCP